MRPPRHSSWLAPAPPQAMASAVSGLKGAIAAAPEAEEALFGFRPGDLLIANDVAEPGSGFSNSLASTDEPIVHIYAEGRTEEDSKVLEAEFRSMVEEIMQTEGAATTT